MTCHVALVPRNVPSVYVLFSLECLLNEPSSIHGLICPYREFLLEGLTILKNRGYDSAGIATIGDPTDGLVSLNGRKYECKFLVLT